MTLADCKMIFFSSFVLLCIIYSSLGERMLAGGKTKMSEEAQSSEEFQSGLIEAVKKFNAMNNAMFKYDVMDVFNATSQIVQGVKYEAVVVFGPTSCRNNPDSMLEKCPFLGDAKHRVVEKHVTIWSRPWLKEKMIVTVDDSPQGENRVEFL
ncbi:cystatin-1-like [Hydractinia symbiolongicarpus]|uniref:cystatin-1-like n=1 Tax=Hydractinia symbiolongicarpus TaxID=13093 RepID=UPI00254A8273|nr:cystatin-1-like [Hydractinia symbiolongicarpus]